MAPTVQSAEHSQKTNGFLINFRNLVPWWNGKSHEIIFIPYEFCISGLSKFFNSLVLQNKLSQKPFWFMDTFVQDCILEFYIFIITAG